jgi:pimeloyl-ACP methyl ester carboxylesterase
MTRQLLHFTHGNSYPSGSYQKYFDQLAGDFDVRSVDMHGHDPALPVTDGWPNLVRELIERIEGYGEPVILVGHSLGGMLSMMAAKQRPELVRCVVMLDSPVVAGWRALMWRVVKAFGGGDRFSPARFSRKRRHLWPDVDAARQHFSDKEVFATWAPGVLDDYLEHGLAPHPEGVQLRFSREVETQIYNALPHHLGGIMRGRYPVPIGFIGGTASEEMRLAGRGPTRRLVGRNFVEIEGGTHLFPMESPALAARLTREMLATLLKQG